MSLSKPLDHGVSLLNLQYAIGFSAVFGALYKKQLSDNVSTTFPQFPDCWFAGLFAFLVMYYFVDWITANALSISLSRIYVLLASVFIWLLAYTAVFTGGQNIWGLCFFGVYVISVATIDFYAIISKAIDNEDASPTVTFGIKEYFERMEPKTQKKFVWTNVFRFAFGAALLTIIIILLVSNSREEGEEFIAAKSVHISAFWLTLGIIMTKILRLKLLLQSTLAVASHE